MPLYLDFLNLFYFIKPTFSFILRAGFVVLITIVPLASQPLSTPVCKPLHSVIPLPVPTQCGVCGFRDGCSLPPTPGD